MASFLFLSFIFILSNASSHNFGEANRFSGTSVEPESRVVGGNEVENGRYPYMVSLVDCYGEHFCGGSLIAPDWVLTSADCGGYASSVHIGRHTTADDTRVRSYEEIGIDYERRHPMFFGITMQNDFNLIKLEENSTYAPVALNDGSVKMDSGTKVTVMGYGTIFPSGAEMSETLLEATISVVPNALCNLVYFCYAQTFITPAMMCAYGFMEDACDGDYGGPLIVKGADASEDVQVGIISWGAFCASPLFPGVYSRVSSRENWITSTISGKRSFGLLSRLKFDAFQAYRRDQYKKHGKSIVGPDKKKLQQMKKEKYRNEEASRLR